MNKIFLPSLYIFILTLLSACSVQKMAGKEMIAYTKDEAIPYVMASNDLHAVCNMGQSLGLILESLSRIKLNPSQLAIATQLSSGICAELNLYEHELRRYRALANLNTKEAQDALTLEKNFHKLAATRFLKAYNFATNTYNFNDNQCPKFETTLDEALALFGLASGALAVLHDFNAEKSANVPLDIPKFVEKHASCFDNNKWWALPDALKAAIWLSIPGAGPKNVDPLQTLENAAKIGDKNGVALPRALYAQMANTVGKPQLACNAINTQNNEHNKEWALIDAYGLAILQHQANIAWTKKHGSRAPFLSLTCPTNDENQKSDDSLDNLLDDLDDDTNNNNRVNETTNNTPPIIEQNTGSLQTTEQTTPQ